VKLVQGTVEKTLPDTTAAGYEVARARSIENIGRQLKAIYETVLNG
jgi:1,2-diacylglycerol-3-alpha-glucose alpha-1,2-glucosyltransferase